jgi:WD40 repeat protein
MIGIGVGVVAFAGVAVLAAKLYGLFDRDSNPPRPRLLGQASQGGGAPSSRVTPSASAPQQDVQQVAAAGSRPFRRLPNPPGTRWSAHGLAFNRDGTVLAAADEDKVVRVWDVPACTLRLTFKGHAQTPMGVALTPDGKTAASVGQDSTLRIWDTADGKERFVLKKDVFATSGVACSPDGSTLAWGAFLNIRLWDLATLKEVGVLKGPKSFVTRMAFLPDGKLLALGDNSGGVEFWHYRTRKRDRAFHPGQKLAAVTLDGKAVATIDGSYKVHLWDAATGRRTKDVPATNVQGVAFSPDGTMVATAGDPVHVWKLATMERIATLGDGGLGYEHIVFSADGKRLAAGSALGVHVWEVTQQRP